LLDNGAPSNAVAESDLARCRSVAAAVSRSSRCNYGHKIVDAMRADSGSRNINTVFPARLAAIR